MKAKALREHGVIPNESENLRGETCKNSPSLKQIEADLSILLARLKNTRLRLKELGTTKPKGPKSLRRAIRATKAEITRLSEIEEYAPKRYISVKSDLVDFDPDDETENPSLLDKREDRISNPADTVIDLSDYNYETWKDIKPGQRIFIEDKVHVVQAIRDFFDSEVFMIESSSGESFWSDEFENYADGGGLLT